MSCYFPITIKCSKFLPSVLTTQSSKEIPQVLMIRFCSTLELIPINLYHIIFHASYPSVMNILQDEEVGKRASKSFLFIHKTE